jgi:hypothetical protein
MSGKFIRAASVIVAPVAALSVLLVGPATLASATPATALLCQASMSNAHPGDGTTVYVHVRTGSHAKVTATAHYKAGKTEASRTANKFGRTTLSYAIGHAAPGFKVVVSVTVKSGTAKGSCSTSFTPHA